MTEENLQEPTEINPGELGAELESELADEASGEELSEEEQAFCELPLPAQVEAIVFANDRPLKVADIQDILIEEVEAAEIEEILKSLVEEYASREGGFRLYNLKGIGYQFQTEPKAGPLMERQFSKRPRPLSRAAQETLAIIAYRQPVTRAEIEFIRGVDAGSIMKGLLDRKLIKCVGRKDVAGRPMLFGTSNDFLQIFGIGSLKELPPLEAFQPEQDMVDKAMEVIESGDEDVDVDALIEDGEAEAAALEVDGIEKPAALPEEVEELKKAVASAEEHIDEALGEDDLEGATGTEWNEEDEESDS